MHALLEFLPLFGLGGGYLLGKSINPDEAMYYLSYGAIIGTLLQFAIFKIRKEKMQKMTLITGLLLIVFATLTVVLRNPLFVELKPTVLSWAFALFFWGYAFFTKTTLLEKMMGEQFQMQAKNWLTLNWFWVIFNIVIGAANLWVAIMMSEEAWATFKLAVLPIASLVFVAGQTVYLFKNGKMIEKSTDTDKTTDTQNNDQREM
ncbi:MAG: septation protein IspZ [Gammaproteobacteria bacterium]|nr:septation protein IspZ [Gammaproteobacteria bacterium]